MKYAKYLDIHPFNPQEFVYAEFLDSYAASFSSMDGKLTFYDSHWIGVLRKKEKMSYQDEYGIYHDTNWRIWATEYFTQPMHSRWVYTVLKRLCRLSTL